MSDFPTYVYAPPCVTITPWSVESIGSDLVAAGARTFNLGASPWPTANRATIVPFHLATTFTAVKVFWLNAVVVSGNVDLGVYTPDGTRLMSTGSTAQVGTSTLQVVDITDTTFPPGDYYLAITMDNTTGQFFAVSPDVFKAGLGAIAGVFPLPATATFTSVTITGNQLVPLFGLTSRTVL